MRLGCWTPLYSKEEGVENPFQFAVDELHKAEDQGFDMALVAERWAGPWLEAWVLSAALAAATKKIELITAVHPGVLNPQVVAKMAASIDLISGGRCAVNIVGGWQQKELEIYGNGGWLEDEHARHKRMEEFLHVLKGLWTEEQFSFEGDFYAVASHSPPINTVSVPHPRIYAVGHSEEGRDVVAKYGDVWFIDAPPNHRRFEQNFAAIERDVKSMNGRSGGHNCRVECYLNGTVLLADSLEIALGRADDLELSAKGNRQRSVPGGIRGLGLGLVGPPALVADRMRRYQDVGIAGFMLRFFPLRTGRELFSRSVMPHLTRH